MKKILYGALFGAAGVYFYMTHGSLVDSTIGAALDWRNSAQRSVHGYSDREFKYYLDKTTGTVRRTIPR